VKKVTRTGAGAHLLADGDLACRIVAEIAEAVDLPVTVKLRRGVRNGSRGCLELGPRLVAAGAQSLTLHPRSAEQMYTGMADHTLTAELVALVDVPVVASGDVTSHARAQAVLAGTGAAAVMVGRGAQGNPWALREIVDGDGREPTREEVAAELVLFVREAVGPEMARPASRSSTAGTRRGRFPPFRGARGSITEEVERFSRQHQARSARREARDEILTATRSPSFPSPYAAAEPPSATGGCPPKVATPSPTYTVLP
jgi:tRNA-dihydrouridine synthase